MKMEPFPWLEGHFIKMDELYTELTLEKIERKLLGEETATYICQSLARIGHQLSNLNDTPALN